MKNLILILLLFITKGYSQSITVEYNVQGYNGFSQEILMANNSRSLYRTSSRTIVNKDTLTQISENTYDIRPEIIKMPEMQYFNSAESTSLYIVNLQPKKTPVVALDSLPSIKWTIFSEQKKEILGFDCIKAKANFRGSEIEAYFTEKIPVPFGPFKFKGLPGLILEVYNVNSNNKYKWEAVNIQYPSNIESNVLIFENNYADVKIESLENLVKKFQRKLNNLDSRTTSSLPRGTTYKAKTTRMGIEQIYEWEQ